MERARNVLALPSEPVLRVAVRLGVNRPMVWRWQPLFAKEAVEGLLRDQKRRPGKAPIAAETVARVVAMTCAAPPHQATHWTGRAMAKPPAFRCGRFSASGRRTSCNRIASAP